MSGDECWSLWLSSYSFSSGSSQSSLGEKESCFQIPAWLLSQPSLTVVVLTLHVHASGQGQRLAESSMNQTWIFPAPSAGNKALLIRPYVGAEGEVLI